MNAQGYSKKLEMDLPKFQNMLGDLGAEADLLWMRYDSTYMNHILDVFEGGALLSTGLNQPSFDSVNENSTDSKTKLQSCPERDEQSEICDYDEDLIIKFSIQHCADEAVSFSSADIENLGEIGRPWDLLTAQQGLIPSSYQCSSSTSAQNLDPASSWTARVAQGQNPSSSKVATALAAKPRPPRRARPSAAGAHLMQPPDASIEPCGHPSYAASGSVGSSDNDNDATARGSGGGASAAPAPPLPVTRGARGQLAYDAALADDGRRRQLLRNRESARRSRLRRGRERRLAEEALARGATENAGLRAELAAALRWIAERAPPPHAT